MQKKIKIAHVSVFYPPDGGGGEFYLERMIKALGKFDHYVWTTTELDQVVAKRSGENCFFEHFEQTPDSDSSTWLDWFEEKHQEIFLSIRRWLKRVQCDVLLINNFFSYFHQTKPFIESLRSDLPIGIIRHDIPIKSFLFLLKEFELTQSWEESVRKVRPELMKFARGENTGVLASPFCLDYDFTIYNSEWAKEFVDPYGEKENIIFHPLILRTHELPELGLKPVDITIVNPLPNKGGALFLALARFHFRDLKIRILAGGYNSAMTK